MADNASGDGTRDAVRERVPRGHARRAPGEPGLRPGRIAGVARMGSGEAIVLANNDMLVEPQFLERDRRAAPPRRARRDGGRTTTISRTPTWWSTGSGSRSTATLIAFNRLRHRSPANARRACWVPSGGAAAYRRVRLGGRRRLRRGTSSPTARISTSRCACARSAGRQPRHRGARRAPRWRHRRSGLARPTPPQRVCARVPPAPLRGPACGRQRARLLGGSGGRLGSVRHRTLVPLRARISGWRAAGRGDQRALPSATSTLPSALSSPFAGSEPRASGRRM